MRHQSRTDQNNQAVWHHESPHDSVMTLGVWMERHIDGGEDAEPLALHYRPGRTGVIAVCDGAGGAGSAIAGTTRDGRARTGAWTASRATRLAVEQWFVEGVAVMAAPARPTTQTTMKESIRSVLDQLRSPGRSRIQGTMQNDLPSTLAAIVYSEWDAGPRRLRLRVYWAGDSRTYLLTPVEGLQQLSIDDTEAPDALFTLLQDPPMTNKVSAGVDFRINTTVIDEVESPCVLICATDGFFNYVRSPAHFEHVLLDTLGQATSLEDWGRGLAEAVNGYSQDDATLALAAVGYDRFEDLKRSFSRHAMELYERLIRPLDELSQDSALLRPERERLWEVYRSGYERRTNGRAGEHR